MAECRGEFIDLKIYESGIATRIEPDRLIIDGFCAVRLSLLREDGSTHSDAAEFPVRPVSIEGDVLGSCVLWLCFVDEDFQKVFEVEARTDSGLIVSPFGVIVHTDPDQEKFEVSQGYFSSYSSPGSLDDKTERMVNPTPSLPEVGELVSAI